MGADIPADKSPAGEQEASDAVFFDEVARPLRLFAQALCGKRFILKSLKESPAGFQGSFGFHRHMDRDAIFLPEVFRRFPAPRMNFLAYKLATAHQAGYAEFGTLRFKLSSVHDLFPPERIVACLQSILKEAAPRSPIEAFFLLFPEKDLARDLFHVLEGARIDHSLRREYRGLKMEMDDFLQAVLTDRNTAADLPLQETMIEYIVRSTAHGDDCREIPRAALHCCEELLSAINPLLEKGATVEDSARATAVIYRLISSMPNVPLNALQPDLHSKRGRAPSEIRSDAEETDFALPAAEGAKRYRSMQPLPHWGQLGPELLQSKVSLGELRPLLEGTGKGFPLSAGELRELLEKGLELNTQTPGGDGHDGFPFLSVTGLKNLRSRAVPASEANEPAAPGAGTDSLTQPPCPEEGEDDEQGSYYYDEWDYRIGDFRARWCRLKEKHTKEGFSGFVAKTLESHAALVAEVRRQFQMLKPEYFKKTRQLERGEEIDLDAAIEASVDARAGLAPSEKIYVEKERKERDFSTLFLLDMSASTNDRVDGKAGTWRAPPPAADKIIINPRFYDPEYAVLCAPSPAEGKMVIDIEKEALVIMAEALKEIGDEYAIFGFSSCGRKDVEFYTIKDFDENYGEEVKRRIDGVEPQRSTRMGTAIRHALAKISGRGAKTKNIILISDGYPQDQDYGEDRSSMEYGLQDTKMALQEAARRNIHLFCITVDLAGNDYLRRMCHDSQYLVIEETAELPRVLPKIYRRLTT